MNGLSRAKSSALDIISAGFLPTTATQTRGSLCRNRREAMLIEGVLIVKVGTRIIYRWGLNMQPRRSHPAGKEGRMGTEPRCLTSKQTIYCFYPPTLLLCGMECSVCTHGVPSRLWGMDYGFLPRFAGRERSPGGATL